MIVIGTDTHKQTHTVAAANSATGALCGELTAPARTPGFAGLLDWGRALDDGRIWAIEDCRHVSGSFERFLVERGEKVVRVPPKLMGQSRRGERTAGKSDAIDALAIARAALKEGPETLPAAHLDEKALQIKLLLDHREDLVRARTADQGRLRWHLHDLWPGYELERQIKALVLDYAPELLELPGCAALTAAKILAETAGVARFSSDAKLARLAGVAPIPASSGKTSRHRLDRGGNRQLNCAFHRMAVAQGRFHAPARSYLARKEAEGKGRMEALRCLKRQLVRVVWRTLRHSESFDPNLPKLQSIQNPALAAGLT
jgi:transposase